MIGDVQPSARPAPVARQKSGFEWVVDRIWRFFCSVRVGIYEIIFLALLVLIGALRNSSVPQALADAVPATKPLVERWYAWDVYHSAIFMVTMTLLAIGIAIGGIINRAPGLWAAIAHPTVTTTHGFLRGADVAANATAAAAPADLAETVAGAFRDRRYRVLTAQVGEETHLYADRNRYGKLGTVPLHVALILVLVGGIVGARWGFRDTDVMVPEGSVREIGHDTGLSVRLNRFDEDYNEDGSAKTYRSNLTVLKDGQPVWFGCDVGKMLERDLGILDMELFDYASVYGFSYRADKAERVEYGHSMMTHAMVFTGVDLDADDRPRKWRVENSWGDKIGDKGFLVMSDRWFDEYMYEVVVDKRFVPAALLPLLEADPTVLPPWDPMGALAAAE